MTTPPRLIAFDLDDTLAASKSPLSSAMAERLIALLGLVPVCIISGGQFGQFSAQVIEQLGDATPEAFERLHLMPTCGTQYFRFVDGTWATIYAQDLTDDEKSRALTALEQEAKRLGHWEAATWGPILEDRGSQITFSALGQQAPVEAKAAWDPTGEKKNELRAAVQELLPALEVRSGGSTSVDITRKGVDKAYGMARLIEWSGIPATAILFLGDALYPGGNDAPVREAGIDAIQVSTLGETARAIEAVILCLKH